MNPITTLLKEGVVLGDGGYLIELERRGYVDSGSGREKVGTGKGSGQFTPEVAIENPDALRELHREFLNAGESVEEKLQAALLSAEIDQLYVNWGLLELIGLEVDGVGATPEMLASAGPEDLFREALSAIKAECGLTEDERKN